jgi:hypothetical protein
MNNPIEFALWLNGFMSAIDSDGPTKKQWDTINENLSEVVGRIVADKILEQADTAVKANESARANREALMALQALKAQPARYSYTAPVEYTGTTAGIVGLGVNIASSSSSNKILP